MTGNISPFRIEILDVNNVLVGGGPITTAFDLTDVKKLDGIGSLIFSMPAGDRKAQFIQTGVKFDVYDEKDGYLGRFLFGSKTIVDSNGNADLNVKCYELTKELTFNTVGFFRDFNFTAVGTILDNIITEAPNWSIETDSENISTISYSGESVFRAIDELRDRTGEHFRLKFDGITSNPILEFGAFGDVSPVLFDQFKGQVQAEWDNNPNTAIVTDMTLEEQSEEVWNKAIPLGFGQGVSQLNISTATLGTYAVQSELNQDGSLRYFISDSISISDFGIREKILQFPNIRPISNSTANEQNAANALKLSAEAYLQRHLTPQVIYKMSVVGLRQQVQVGDKIHVRYSAEIDGVNYIDLDTDFWVLTLTKNRNVSGSRSQSFIVSEVDNIRTSDRDVIVDVVRNLNSIAVHVPATLAYAPIGPYTKRIKGDASENERINAQYIARIQNEVLYINRALLRFKTEVLTSSAAGANHSHLMFSQPAVGAYAATTGKTVCADSIGSGGLINLNIDFQTGNFPTTPLYTFGASGGAETIEYGVFEDDVFPRTISLLINGVDRSSELGGPWAVSVEEVELELDVTDILIEDGIRRNHNFTFTAESGHGQIEMELDLLVTIQPIAVT